MKENIFVYFIGTAGSGKSALTHAFKEWLTQRGLDCIAVNLDPGAEKLPYNADVDVQDWVSLKDTMKEYDLGPNGAQIACADMLALNTKDIKESIDSFKTDYILMDTPGQLELFVFREAGKFIVNYFNKERSIVAYLLDPALAREASGFVSQLLLSVSAQFRLNISQTNILSKTDMLSSPELKHIKNWSKNPEELYTAVTMEEASVYREMSENIVRFLDDFGGFIKLIPTSSETLLGIDDLYTIIQMEFEGGEDLMSD